MLTLSVDDLRGSRAPPGNLHSVALEIREMTKAINQINESGKRLQPARARCKSCPKAAAETSLPEGAPDGELSVASDARCIVCILIMVVMFRGTHGHTAAWTAGWFGSSQDGLPQSLDQLARG
jgi:hypothetical protein